MSYILDALRKADAERERDPARGIHAQPLAPLPAAPAPPAALLWAGLAGGALIAVAGGALLWDRAQSPVARPQVLQAPVAVPLAAPPVVVAPATAAVIPVAAAPVVHPAPPPRPVAAAAVAAPTPMVIKAPAAAKPPAEAAASKKAEPAATPIYAFADLPAELQRELPKLAITGGIHSDNAAQRMLIVGGQVMNEGAEVAPGVVLEQIRARAAVLRFKGYRYSVAY